ncbi:uncharacterized protein LOC142345297 [Convolutriloba macropyga]|uniref:uncharacterized protein LOC142345297 n=1 Tax=Convolutriloba macropyga TaxID=536237 RepID=UPI003F51F948
MAHLAKTLIIVALACFTKCWAALDLANFVQECDCLMAYGDSIANYTALTAQICTAACFAQPQCIGFSYCERSRECQLFSRDTLGYVKDAVMNNDCSGHPSEPVTSSKKWYWINEVENAQTQNCQTLWTANPGNSNGYYEVVIRGVKTWVYCFVYNSQPLTYIDIGGYSYWGGSTYGLVSPFDPARTVFHRAQVNYDSCLATIQTVDQQFTSYYDGASAANNHLMGVGNGGSCFGDEYGSHVVDIRGTIFQFPGWVTFAMTGDHVETINTTYIEAQYSYLEGFGNCGIGTALTNQLDLDEDARKMTERIPLLLYVPTKP